MSYAGQDTLNSRPSCAITLSDDASIANTFQIRAKQTSNRAPVFEDDEGDRITSTTREIEENATNLNVGAVVVATDADDVAGSTNRLTYTLGGPDADSFKINRGEPGTNGATTDPDPDNAGQITANEAPDYETKSVYTVVVTATDGSGASASITVVINVTDVDPEPIRSWCRRLRQTWSRSSQRLPMN